MSSVTDAHIEGIRAAEQVPLTQRMQDLLAEHGFGADFLNDLTPDEEALIPDCPYEDDEGRDDWNTAFAQTLEQRA